MKRVINKINNTKKLLLVVFIIFVIILLFYKQNTKTQEIKNKNSKISIIIENEEGNTEVSSFPPNDGIYTFHKIMCDNLSSSTSVAPTWDNTNWRLSVTASSTSNIDGQFNCDIYFKKTFATILKENNPPRAYTTRPGRAISTTDEGLIEGSNDDYGAKTYYFRGTAPDNYVTFAGLTWRIVRINGDGSVRLILNGKTGTNTAWGQRASTTWSTALSYTVYANSTIKGKVETWYNTNIGNNTNYSSKVATSKFCNDRTYTTDGGYYRFGTYNRLYPSGSTTNANPSYICPNSAHVYNLKVGILTGDEVAFAGGIRNTANSSYYLYRSGVIWWTISPCHWHISTGHLYAWAVLDDGTLRNGIHDTSSSVRPVISLSSDVSIITASPTNPGTSTNPYIVQ